MFGLEDYNETKILKRNSARYVPERNPICGRSDEDGLIEYCPEDCSWEDFYPDDSCIDDHNDDNNSEACDLETCDFSDDWTNSDNSIITIERDGNDGDNDTESGVCLTTNDEENNYDLSGWCASAASSDFRVLSEDLRSDDPQEKIFDPQVSKEHSSDGINPEQSIQDLSELITNPAATFFFRVSGKAMSGDGITEEDILIVDRSRNAKNGDIIVAVISGCYVVRRLEIRQGIWSLTASYRYYRSIPLTNNRQIWGVVTNIVHRI